MCPSPSMAGLQRSAVSFRRQGSSGFVWDDRFLSGELNKLNHKEDHHHQEQQQDLEHHHHNHKGTSSEIKELNTPSLTIERSRSNGAGGRGYRTGKVSPAIEPPSPKLSACGFCGAFGKTGDKGQRSKPGKHRSR